MSEGLAETDETWFGRCLRMPGIFLQGIQILGLHTNEGVTDQNQRLVRGPSIVRRRDSETARRIRSQISRRLSDVRNGTVRQGNEVCVEEETSTQCSQNSYWLASNLRFTNSSDYWLV